MIGHRNKYINITYFLSSQPLVAFQGTSLQVELPSLAVGRAVISPEAIYFGTRRPCGAVGSSLRLPLGRKSKLVC